MTADRHDPRDDNPLGLGPRDAESSNTGSTADTSYDAVGSDPYTTGEPEKDFGGVRDGRATPQPGTTESRPADPEVPSSDEP